MPYKQYSVYIISPGKWYAAPGKMRVRNGRVTRKGREVPHACREDSW
jgi:hypothetical protein